MLNLIGNSCASSFIMTDPDKLNQELINPFSYNIIDFKSFYTLITNFNKIDYQKIELIKNKNFDRSILVDKKVLLHFPHYIYDSKIDYLKDEKNHNVYSKKIDVYTLGKYVSRLEKMLRNKIEPVFLVAAVEGKENDYSVEQIKSILSINSNQKIIVATKKSIDIKNGSNRELIIVPDTVKTDGRPLANYIWSTSNLLNRILK